MAGHVYPFAATRGRRYVGAIVFGLFLSGGGGGQAWGPMTDTDKTDLARNGRILSGQSAIWWLCI